MRLGWKGDDALGVRSWLPHLREQLTVVVGVGSNSFNFCGKRPKQTVRDSPGKEQALLLSSPEGGQGQGRDPKTLRRFTHLKICRDCHSFTLEILGSFHECIQVQLQVALLREQRTHLRGGVGECPFNGQAEVLPTVFEDCFQGHPWTIFPSSPSCPGCPQRTQA